jgi:anaerobic ribonucleoside-triphosphate reductase activating protein
MHKPEKEFLYIHHLAVLDDILGPGRRLVIWTTGCPFRCPGCIEEKLHRLEAGTPYPVRDLFETIEPLLSELRAITFTGGEPLFQAAALRELLVLLRGIEQINIMLYTGLTTSEFNRRHSDLTRFIDICITGPFIKKKHTNHLWRGSDNQEIISPSGVCRKQLTKWRTQPSAGIRFHFNKDECFIYGVPAANTMDHLNRILCSKQIHIREKEAGSTAFTEESSPR